MLRSILVKAGVVLSLLLSQGLYAEESAWIEEDVSDHQFPSDLQEGTADYYNALWRCDAAPITYGLTTYWIHASPYVACQIAVSKCQQFNGVACLYHYYRVQ